MEDIKLFGPQDPGHPDYMPLIFIGGKPEPVEYEDLDFSEFDDAGN